MSLTIPEDSVAYAPRFEAFAREICDYTSDELERNPVAQSASLRQTAELLDPDWLVLSGSKQILGALPARDGRSIREYEFSEVGDGQIAERAEVIQMVGDVRSEQVVCTFPDPVAMVGEVFDSDWSELLSEQTFDVLDTLHRATQFLTDVLRLCQDEGEISGVIVDGTSLQGALAEGLSMDEYLLELGALFNLADHYDVSVIMSIPGTSHRLYDTLADEFDAVLFESVEKSTTSKLPADSTGLGCSFSESIWEADDAKQFNQQLEQYFGALPSNVRLFTQEIPAAARPEHVQRFSDFLQTEF